MRCSFALMSLSMFTAGLIIAVGCKQRPGPSADELKVSGTAVTSLEDPVYTELVNSNKYPEALKYVCKKFPQLDCSLVHLSNKKINTVEVSGNNTAYAVTNIANVITIYQNAFVHQGVPLPGWLAAVIWHEMTHAKKQNAYVRWIASNAKERFLGDYSIGAGMELEAWMSMVEKDQFPMNCNMLMTIQENIYYFNKILERKGKRPANEADEEKNYTMSTDSYRMFMNDCRANLQAKGINVIPKTLINAPSKPNIPMDVLVPENNPDMFDSK